MSLGHDLNKYNKSDYDISKLNYLNLSKFKESNYFIGNLEKKQKRSLILHF